MDDQIIGDQNLKQLVTVTLVVLKESKISLRRMICQTFKIYWKTNKDFHYFLNMVPKAFEKVIAKIENKVEHD